MNTDTETKSNKYLNYFDLISKNKISLMFDEIR